MSSEELISASFFVVQNRLRDLKIRFGFLLRGR